MNTRFFLIGLSLGMILAFVGTYLFMKQINERIEEEYLLSAYIEETRYQDIQYLLQLVQTRSFHLEDFLSIKDTNIIVLTGPIVPGGNKIEELTINCCSFLFDQEGVLKKASMP